MNRAQEKEAIHHSHIVILSGESCRLSRSIGFAVMIRNVASQYGHESAPGTLPDGQAMFGLRTTYRFSGADSIVNRAFDLFFIFIYSVGVTLIYFLKVLEKYCEEEKINMAEVFRTEWFMSSSHA